MEIVIQGQPRTKKNGSRIALTPDNKRVLLPSKAYEQYERVALVQLARVQAVHGPISVVCRYFLQNRAHWPDLVGLLQATSDILQAAGVIDDDKYIVNYDGSMIAGLDKNNPRVEIIIHQITENSVLCEEYAKAKARKCDTTKRAKSPRGATVGAKAKPKAPTSISYKEYRKLIKKGHHTP
nr:MAG TPA: Endodeoxyribonuclease RusA [Caudoviricetes sp.]